MQMMRWFFFDTTTLLIIFSNIHRWGTVVHHAGMVGADELAVETLTGGAVDDVAIDLAVAIDYPTLA